jgi:hypothetical protein
MRMCLCPYMYNSVEKREVPLEDNVVFRREIEMRVRCAPAGRGFAATQCHKRMHYNRQHVTRKSSIGSAVPHQWHRYACTYAHTRIHMTGGTSIGSTARLR